MCCFFSSEHAAKVWSLLTLAGIPARDLANSYGCEHDNISRNFPCDEALPSLKDSCCEKLV